jgi:ABC-type nickel/cobalt efflux system permease component RcnA
MFAASSAIVFDKISTATIHHFALLSRCITDVEGRHLLDISQMNSRAFESPVEPALLSAGIPLPCPRAMPVQTLTDPTSASIAGTLFTAVFALPRALVLAPAVISRSRRA